MMEIKVSIVVPVYKVEKYLDRCLKSLTNQTLKDIEIILVDDNSPDNSLAICNHWAEKDKRIKVIHKENEGLGLTRNAGLRIAQGKYVAFVDSDDYVELNMMERLYSECIKNDLDCVYSEFNVDDYPGYRVVLRPEKLYIGKEDIERLRLDIIGAEPSFVSGVKFQCSSCKGLYSMSVIRNHQVAFLSEREYISEDTIFNLDFLYHAERVKTVPWQFYHYCLNDASLTHTYRPDRWQKLVVMLHKLDEKDKFTNKEELDLRLKRTAIFYTMIAIKQERRRKDITTLEKMKAIRIIENDPVVDDAVRDYPICKLPIKWRIYVIMLKYKMIEYFGQIYR